MEERENIVVNWSELSCSVEQYHKKFDTIFAHAILFNKKNKVGILQTERNWTQNVS